MNGHRPRRLVWCGLALWLGGCVAAEASPAPADGGTPPAAKKKKKAEPTQRPLAELLSGGDGGMFPQAYPECMSAEAAAARAQATDAFGRTTGSIGAGGIGTTSGASGAEEKPRTKRALAECPEYIWTYVGAGHGATPVGNVQAPLGVAATRKERKRAPKTCCYLIPPEPGLPNG